MFGVIKRVISNPEDIGKINKVSKTEHFQSMASPQMTDFSNEETEGRVLVEPEDQLEPDPPIIMHPPMLLEFQHDTHADVDVDVDTDVDVDVDTDEQQSKPSTVAIITSDITEAHSADSSLSDDHDRSRAGALRDEAATLIQASDSRRNDPVVYMRSPHMIRNMARPDSHSSVGTGVNSRDASGNWGWYEDVHGVWGSNGDLERISDKPFSNGMGQLRQSRKNTGGLLQPFSEALAQAMGTQAPLAPLNDMVKRSDNDQAAAMAVTAPTYVLEESLSNQKLWKYTAGNRPPQPFEERAFYEKMWAQNFARSSVEYQAPIEALIVPSPISLSPFAEANFDESATKHPGELTHYDIGSTNDNKATDPHLAEATLINRLHDPNSAEGAARRIAALNETVAGKTVKGTENEGDLIVLIRGDNVFGTTVSKSFARSDSKGGAITGVDTVNISVASYRVVESIKHGKYAQFLVIYREGSIRDTVGVWKRYSDFDELSRKVTETNEGCTSILSNMSPLHVTEEQEIENLPNAITSWRLLKKRQRWWRCLDAGYLSLKVFLLERFLHDILFESSSPKLLRVFALNPESLS